MKIIVIVILYSFLAFTQIDTCCGRYSSVSDSARAAWLQMEQWEVDKRIVESAQWQECNRISQTTLETAAIIPDGYVIEYMFVVDSVEIMRTDNFIYKAVPNPDIPGRLDTLAFHPVLEDGYASFLKRWLEFTDS